MRDQDRALLAMYELELELTAPDELPSGGSGRVRRVLTKALISVGMAAASMFAIHYGSDIRALQSPDHS